MVGEAWAQLDALARAEWVRWAGGCPGLGAPHPPSTHAPRGHSAAPEARPEPGQVYTALATSRTAVCALEGTASLQGTWSPPRMITGRSLR